MSDDFLTQIQKTEQKAVEMTERAFEKKRRILEDYRQKLKRERMKKIQNVHEKSKQKLKEARAEARKTYEKEKIGRAHV